jgi:hypothetical protein
LLQEQEATHANPWTLDKMQAYLCFVKSIEPVMTPVTEAVLTKYYQVGSKTQLSDPTNWFGPTAATPK